MDFFSVLTMLGGVALFIYGMHQMGGSLQKAAGSRLEKMLEKMTSGKMRAVLLGIMVTAVIQSSSTTTVTVVGFVNSGIMRLSQAIPVIMGANVGTTATAWLLSLTGIESSNWVVQLFKPSSFTPMLAVVGVLLIMAAKKPKSKDWGGVMVGFAILMFGMDTMTSAVAPLTNTPGIERFFLMFENPWLGMLAGMVLTAVLQSSSASIGILQALAATGSISYAAALPIIMGQNIGTCGTAVLSGIGANKSARRASMVHLYFNLIGSILVMLLFVSLHRFIPKLDTSVSILGIAVVHTIFNLVTTGLLLPFTGALEKLAILSVPDGEKKKEDVAAMLDERLLLTPSFAVARCSELLGQMARIARDSVLGAIKLIGRYEAKSAASIVETENLVDRYEDVLGTFVVKLNSLNLSASEGREITRVLHGIGDLERMSDHALNLQEAAQELSDKQIVFSEEARAELDVLFRALTDILDMAVTAFNDQNAPLAERVEPLEEVVDDMIRELKSRHVRRLRANKCTVETGFIFADILGNVERVADHCSNLAVCVVELKRGEYNAHEYIEKAGHLDAFLGQVREAQEKYALPLSEEA